MWQFFKDLCYYFYCNSCLMIIMYLVGGIPNKHYTNRVCKFLGCMDLIVDAIIIFISIYTFDFSHAPKHCVLFPYNNTLTVIIHRDTYYPTPTCFLPEACGFRLWVHMSSKSLVLIQLLHVDVYIILWDSKYFANYRAKKIKSVKQEHSSVAERVCCV